MGAVLYLELPPAMVYFLKWAVNSPRSDRRLIFVTNNIACAYNVVLCCCELEVVSAVNSKHNK